VCAPGSDNCSFDTAGMPGASSGSALLRPVLRQWPTTSRALACRQPTAGHNGVKYTMPSLISVTDVACKPTLRSLVNGQRSVPVL
jgi:hypothetical protein